MAENRDERLAEAIKEVRRQPVRGGRRDSRGRDPKVAALASYHTVKGILEAIERTSSDPGSRHAARMALDALHPDLASKVAAAIPGIEPHRYVPDAMAMGDCKVCGHVYEDHAAIPGPAPDERPRTAHEGDDHAFGFDARCGLCQNPDLASKVAAASPEEPRSEDGFSEYRCGGCNAVLPASETHWTSGYSCAAIPGPALDLGPWCRGGTPDSPCDDEACEGHGSAPVAAYRMGMQKGQEIGAYDVRSAISRFRAALLQELDDAESGVRPDGGVQHLKQFVTDWENR